MLATDKRLLELTAGDLMSRDVLAITLPTSVRTAAHRLAEAGVTGAPIVDGDGRCVGVLSATDLMRFLDKGTQAARSSFQTTCFCADWQIDELDTLPDDDVSRYMTTDVVTASPDTSIGELARAMLDAHIHRLIITDRWARPVGIVSTTDILAAVASEERHYGPGEGV